MKHLCLLFVFALSLTSAWAKTSPEAEAAYKDIQKTFGSVPSFMKAVPDEAISGAWQDMKGIQLNQLTAIPGKYKELIGLAVAAQIPCKYCVYFHTQAAKLNKASPQEIKEALALSACVRRWSAVITGNGISEEKFRAETDQMLKFVSNQPLRQAQEAKPNSNEPVLIDTPEKALKDIEQTFGFVPEFLKLYPQSGIVGAWSEMKSLDLNPNTAIPAKYKELIGLAVASQTPCPYCTYFHSQGAKMSGATKDEYAEAVAMAGLTRHWSTILNGSGQDEKSFRAEADKVMNYVRKNMPKEVTSR
ncbi:MAG: carboxymuconolactone decarboxylase family protein [Bacteriovoracaceae bacterium]